MVGVGGMVVNDKEEILVVQEKYSTQAHWKLPGGEDIYKYEKNVGTLFT